VALPTGTIGVNGNAYPESTVCLSGYYLDSIKKICLNCGVGADKCNNVNDATSCKLGYSDNTVEGTCVPC